MHIFYASAHYTIVVRYCATAVRQSGFYALSDRVVVLLSKLCFVISPILYSTLSARQIDFQFCMTCLNGQTGNRNRFDLLQVGIGSNDGTLTVKASKVGRTVLKVWHALRPHLVDYVNIVVEPAVAPSSTWFSAGEVICFRSALAPVGAVAVSSAKAGRWSVSVGAKSDGESGTVSSGGRGGKRLLSDDPGSSGRSGNERGAIAIDQSSGVAVALRPGRASVIFNATSTISTRADIGVSPLSAIRFQLPPTSSGGVVSNAADRLGVVFIPLRFVGRHERASWSGGLMLDASSSADGGSNKESSLLSGAGRRSCAALLGEV